MRVETRRIAGEDFEVWRWIQVSRVHVENKLPFFKEVVKEPSNYMYTTVVEVHVHVHV